MIHPIADERILLLGVRDVDPGEKDNLAASKISVLDNNALKNPDHTEPLQQLLKTFKARIKKVYIHFDIDVLDPQEAPGVTYRSSNGLSLHDALQAIEIISKHFEICAATITAYDPNLDENEKTLRSGIQVIERIVNCMLDV